MRMWVEGHGHDADLSLKSNYQAYDVKFVVSYYCKLTKINEKRNRWSITFILLKDFLSICHFKLIELIGQRAVSERVNIGGLSRHRIYWANRYCTVPTVFPIYRVNLIFRGRGYAFGINFNENIVCFKIFRFQTELRIRSRIRNRFWAVIMG